VAGKHPQAKGFKKAELVAALERLMNSGKLRLETRRACTTREKKVIRFGSGEG
jgi:hypothetical protein